MPCYTLVQVEIKDKVIAEKSLKELNEQADIERTARGTYMVTPKKQSATFKDRFLQRYAMEKTKVEARKEGYKIIEKQEQGEQVLILRQY